MATASSVQREPSMEEILASIRRIIEDSDSGRKQAEDSAEAQPFAEVAEQAEPAPEVETFRSELHAPPPSAKPVTLAEVKSQLSPEAPAAAAGKPTLTLAEIGARIAAEQEGRELDVTAAVAEDLAVKDLQQGRGPVGEKPHPAGQAIGVGTAAPETSLNAQNETSPLESAEHAVGSTAPEQAPSRQVADVQPRPSLVSEQTSRQVAAAFGELSEAFASRSRKSFDEMAEEMLRPMLQDWLDNNLPTLVERLVREEIERVARGA
jgi:cell pole-organizing protein PopZ